MLYHDKKGDEMTTRTDNARVPVALVASDGADRTHGRRVDDRGVVIGPWTASARRANALLRAVRPAL